MTFKVGDKVFVGAYENKARRVTCPVCFGKLEVKLTLGDDTEVMLPCDYCGHGYEFPCGKVFEWMAQPTVDQCTIAEIETRTDAEGEKRSYTMTNHRAVDECDIFLTHEEALHRAEARASEYDPIQKAENDARHARARGNKTYAWNAGYHMREKKALLKKIEYHDRMMKICEEHAEK